MDAPLGFSGVIFYIRFAMKTLSNSPQSRLRYLQRLTQKKYREEEEKFLIEGPLLIQEALESDWEVSEILLTDEFLRKEAASNIIKSAERKNVAIRKLSEKDLKKLSDTVTSQGIIGVVERRRVTLNEFWRTSQGQSIVVALDDISDPGNVGTILRTCDWFNIQGMLLSKNAVELFSPKVVRASMGAIFHLPIIEGVDLPEVLQTAKQYGFKVIVTSLDRGKQLQSVTFPEKSIVILGNEAHGVSTAVLSEADELLTIPRFGKAESLNVAIACGVILSSIRLSQG
jgi:TrmH family RNA methyltransferase